MRTCSSYLSPCQPLPYPSSYKPLGVLSFRCREDHWPGCMMLGLWSAAYSRLRRGSAALDFCIFLNKQSKFFAKIVEVIRHTQPKHRDSCIAVQSGDTCRTSLASVLAPEAPFPECSWCFRRSLRRLGIIVSHS